jgi:hypothetical protein
MEAFPLVVAHLLDCNQFTWDPRAEDVAVLRASARRTRWCLRRSRIAALLRPQREAPDGLPRLAVAKMEP